MLDHVPQHHQVVLAARSESFNRLLDDREALCSRTRSGDAPRLETDLGPSPSGCGEAAEERPVPAPGIEHAPRSVAERDEAACLAPAEQVAGASEKVVLEATPTCAKPEQPAPWQRSMR